MQASEEGCDQILWLFGPEHELTEVGTMNLFVYWKSPNGNHQLITPPLESQIILPGVIRDSVLGLSRQWAEFDVLEARLTMPEVIKAIKEGRLLEIFGTGTAAIITPVNNIRYKGENYEIPLDGSDKKYSAGPLARRLWDSLIAIQYGEIAHEWSVPLVN